MFSFLNMENRTEVQSSLNNPHSLEVLRIHRSELAHVIFKDEGKEFMYDGEMYDMQSISTDGDYMVFHCINDNTEKELLSGLNSHVKNNFDTNSTPTQKQDSSKKIIKDLFLHKNIVSQGISIPVLFPTGIFNLTSYIPETLPLLPPEAACA